MNDAMQGGYQVTRNILDNEVAECSGPPRRDQLFGKALSVVAIVAAPRSEVFEQRNLRQVHENIEVLFPNATIKRYALILGASENCSLTLVISGSGCLVPDACFAIRNYIFGCMLMDNRDQEQFKRGI